MLPHWAVVTPERVAHIERVVSLLSTWADAVALDAAQRDRWLRAAWLHDALRDQLLADPLAHGPAAADRAAAEGERDRGVLEAIRYHSVGWADWDDVGRALYCADFLEPGRDFAAADRVGLTHAFPVDARGVLREVVRHRVSHAILSGWRLLPETVAFWNAHGAARV